MGLLPAMPDSPSIALPEGVTVLERGWLSSNNVVLVGPDQATLVDSGYGLHAPQTLMLVESALQGRPLDLLVNTHLHSDHCGGNAALQARYPQLQTLIPPGHAQAVAVWNEDVLTYKPTGQVCPRFGFSATLNPGTEIRMGQVHWQVHAAPGHDTHSVILFEPASRTLISADALWQRGFGVVFPELDGESAFDEVAATLDVIESLGPRCVIPGHGSVFCDVAEAIAFARKRLEGFASSPAKHLQYAAKVLLKFKLLELQTVPRTALLQWASSTPYFQSLFKRQFAGLDFNEGLELLVKELVRAGAAEVRGDVIVDVS